MPTNLNQTQVNQLFGDGKVTVLSQYSQRSPASQKRSPQKGYLCSFLSRNKDRQQYSTGANRKQLLVVNLTKCANGRKWSANNVFWKYQGYIFNCLRAHSRDLNQSTDTNYKKQNSAMTELQFIYLQMFKFMVIQAQISELIW